MKRRTLLAAALGVISTCFIKTSTGDDNRIELCIDGAGPLAYVLYTARAGDHRVENVQLPWRVLIPTSAGDYAVTAQRIADEGAITFHVKSQQQVHTSITTEGASAFVSCSGNVHHTYN